MQRSWIRLYADLAWRWWMPSRVSIYLAFRAGLVLSVTSQPLARWICWINPWANFSKAAAHGLIGENAVALSHWRVFEQNGLAGYLRERFVRYLGRHNPQLALHVLQGHVKHQRLAEQIVALSTTRTAQEDRSGEFRLRLTDTQLFKVNELISPKKGGLVERSDCSPFGFHFKAEKKSSSRPGGSSQEPLVSIILTVFNGELLLKSSVESLLGQTHGRLEVWLVDDASTDQTWAVIQELCAQDSRLRAIRLRKNIGTYAAKSLVLPSISGEYVTCHDADDLASPYWIETQLTPMLRDPECVASVSRWFRIDSTGAVVPGSSRDVWPVLSLNQTSLLMRRRVLDSIGGWDIARVSGDVEIFERIRTIHGVQAVRVIDQALVVGLHIPTSLMNDATVGLASGDQRQLARHLQYREAWVEWQASCLRAGELPRMPDISSRVRPFVSPKAFEVAHEDVLEAIACVEQQVMAHDESARH